MVADVNSTFSETVKRAEIDFILGRKNDDKPTQPSLWGLALSGGGIRSATFSLGVLQVLARNGLLGCFHYQSTISGGGYAGAFVQGLISRRGFDRAFEVLQSSIRDSPASQDQTAGDSETDPYHPILHLREYSNYLSPRKSPLSGDALGMFGTYLRNVLLVQIQLCALLLALSMLPLFFYPWFAECAAYRPAMFMVAGGLFGIVAAILIGWVTTQANGVRAPKKKPTFPFRFAKTSPAQSPTAAAAPILDSKEAPPPGAARTAALAMFVLAVSAMFGAAGLWGLNKRLFDRLPPGTDIASANHLQWVLDQKIVAFTALFYFVPWMIWLAIDWNAARKRRAAGVEDWRSPLTSHPVRFVFSSILSCFVAGLALVATRHLMLDWHGLPGLWQAMILGPSCVLIALTVTGVVHLGFAGPALNDLHREVWARIGGKAIGFVVAGVGLATAVAIYGPLFLRYGLSVGITWGKTTGWIGAIVWLVTSASGLLAAYGQRVNGDPRKRARFMDRVVAIAPWLFLLGLLVLISSAAQTILTMAGAIPTGDAPQGFADLANYYFVSLTIASMRNGGIVLIVLGTAVGIWLLFGFMVDHNEFSMNAFYRNRLVRCYLGASNQERNAEPITNFDPRDDIVLQDVVKTRAGDGTRPLFPLIGTALNLLASKQLDWQDRKAASFCLTPGYCGYLPPPSHPDSHPVGDADAAIAGTQPPATAAKSNEKSSDEKRAPPVASTLKLGDAMAISGAAVSPNMGYHSSPAVTFLLTLFDARLGWWLPNPKVARSKHASQFFGWWLIAEMLGLTKASGRYVYLSDGGHFDNLGLYELVRRGCRFILCVDASADPDGDFADLGAIVQKCRTDFGVDIRVDVSGLHRDAAGNSSRTCAVGNINYPNGETGTLLYLKPSLTGSEPTDVAHYASAHPSFPHEPTSDQFFDEAQFESYRRLGECVAISALAPALERAGLSRAPVPGLHDSDLKDRILIELQHRWIAAPPAAEGRFATHADAMSKLFAQLRKTPSLSVLDAQIYPSWIDLVKPSETPGHEEPATPFERRTRLPTKENFRSCFYFCQELTQLMEAVYHDLKLEQAWDHPDNRGWMNMFRHWSWAPIFRVAWSVGAPTFGRSFVTFCELRLDLPRLNALVGVAEVSPKGKPWASHCDELAKTGRINHVEHAILISEPIIKGVKVDGLRLLLLQMNWQPILERPSGRISETTCGVAVLDGTTLKLLRVQDHLRRMGLGLEFMRHVLRQHNIERIEVKKGFYGPAGDITESEAKATAHYLEGLLSKAQAQ
jgi:hypothetical protein